MSTFDLKGSRVGRSSRSGDDMAAHLKLLTETVQALALQQSAFQHQLRGLSMLFAQPQYPFPAPQFRKHKKRKKENKQERGERESENEREIRKTTKLFLEPLYYSNLPFNSPFPPPLPASFPSSLSPLPLPSAFPPSLPPSLPSHFPISLASSFAQTSTFLPPPVPPSPLPSVPSQSTIPRPSSSTPDQSRYQLSLAPEGRGHILLVQPRAAATSDMEGILSFLRGNVPYFQEQLVKRGALLLRNVGARDPADFAELCNVFGQSRDYKDGLSPFLI